MTRTRRSVIAGTAAAPALLAAPAVHAQERIRWRMATSWPKNLPGPGLAAAYLARRVAELSGGSFEIQLFGAGEIVPALQVLDAVGNGTVEMGHSAAFFWQGKNPAANAFTTLPFGPDPIEHQAWLERGGGQALWDELYRPFAVKPLLAGNTGPSMAGWFKRELGSAADLRGLKIRAQGLGAELWQRLGATALTIAPGDLLISLSSGVIDAVEFLAPVNDLPLGLYKPAPFYYAPGFNKPNGAAEAIIHLPAWEKLSSAHRAMLEAASAEAHARGLVEAQNDNAGAMLDLVTNHQVQLRRLPADLLAAARQHARDLVQDLAAKSELSGRIIASMEASRTRARPWRRVTLAGSLAMQGD
ncbi:MAG: TRAP transporter substrate-binding protein [Beijerinckiaceae bacterium]|nr:TRAP transporter substrate-binding protein [Beijerinckiaceae bacterium]